MALLTNSWLIALSVDVSFLKDGWLFFGENGGFFGVWDKIKDTMPDNNQQKPHKPGTAAAANPVCWTCKSSDLMMDWAYLGDPKAGAKWSRASNPVELVRNINHALNCNLCHDPHSAQPRVIRDAFDPSRYTYSIIRLSTQNLPTRLR